MWALAPLLSPGHLGQSLWQVLSFCPLWKNACCALTEVCLVLRSSPGASIAWVGTASYDDLKGIGEVTIVMPRLRVVLSLNQMSDNVMIVIEKAGRLG